jgi:hypothetical protein
MMRDVGALVKMNPGPSILAAAAVGFLVGGAFLTDGEIEGVQMARSGALALMSWSRK